VVGVVVLGCERLQAEARTGESQLDDVVIRDEPVGHIASLRGSEETVPHKAAPSDAQLRLVAEALARSGAV
jgi:hypothetical protein